MANPEQVAILKEGVEAWNNWQNENTEVRPNLSGANMRGANLIGANLSRANLSRANLFNANLFNANLIGADLSGAKLSVANLIEAKLIEAKLIEADLVEADLTFANLSGANLSEANLRRANLREADLRGAYLINANLIGADLVKADLFEANLSEANLIGAYLNETIIANVDLSKVAGLEEITHWGPSTIDHTTLTKSRNLPDVFLRGVGLQNWQIEEAKLLQPYLSNSEINDIIYRVYDLRAHQAIQISPLFISYSHENARFVDAIEKKLIDKGVRFWRDIHNMTAGKMEKQVDRAMSLNDTVLLVLSKESVNSDWVEHEATKARKLEKERGQDVLCPIALDDAWKTCSWDQRLRLQIEKYSILDFSNWKDDEVFSRQFSKLLDGLDIFYQ